MTPHVDKPPYLHTLSAFELQFLVMAAERRNCVKAVHGVANRRCQHGSDFDANLCGIIGEYVVAKMLGKRIDTSVSLAGDGGVSDLHVCGHSLQIKTRQPRPSPIYLYLNSAHEASADILVCCQIVTLTKVHVLGWLPRVEFLDKAKPMNFGYGPRIGVCATALRHASTLQTWASEQEQNEALAVGEGAW